MLREEEGVDRLDRRSRVSLSTLAGIQAAARRDFTVVVPPSDFNGVDQRFFQSTIGRICILANCCDAIAAAPFPAALAQTTVFLPPAKKSP